MSAAVAAEGPASPAAGTGSQSLNLPGQLLASNSRPSSSVQALTPISGAGTPLSTSSHSSSESEISRQSSCRSTTSVQAVPIRKPVRQSAQTPASMSRAGSAVIGRQYDTPPMLHPGPSGSHSPTRAPPDHYFARQAAMKRLGSENAVSSEAATPSEGVANSVGMENGLSSWSDVGQALQKTTRPANERKGSTTLSDLPKKVELGSRNGSEASVMVLRKTAGDFQFERILGEGSYSTVTQVSEKQPPHRSYALKVLDKEHIKREKKTKYVIIERDTLKALDGHPGIIRLYWTFQDQRSLYYVLELARNGELLKWIREYGSFNMPAARFYAAQILSAIEHMHSKGILHRDLKPENILLDSKMRVKITDFGTAKQLDGGSTQDGTETPPRTRSFVGTPEYVSPEILSEGRESSKASDYWGFGCIVFQMIAGRPPFQAKTEYLMFQKIINLEYEFPEGFPDDAKDLVQKLLVVDPTKRLGADSIHDIKSHPFFDSLDFDTIWTMEPPKLETGLAPPKPVQVGQFVLEDEDASSAAFDYDSDGGSRADESEGGEESPSTNGGAQARHSPPKSKWDSILLPSEMITFASKVHVRRKFIPRKRTLLLTDYPRLLCVKEAGHKTTLKSEVFLGRPQGDASRSTFVSANADSSRSFTVTSTKGQSKYEEPAGMAMRWVSELGDAHQRAQQSK